MRSLVVLCPPSKSLGYREQEAVSVPAVYSLDFLRGGVFPGAQQRSCCISGIAIANTLAEEAPALPMLLNALGADLGLTH